ncbi:MAG: hypothetical protein IJT73_02135, partial [Selenomonadaceae bacterium]|nr:hypothetical protein [Selenomonadaceae bacterium]
FIFGGDTKRVVNRQVKFLYRVGRIGGRANCHVRNIFTVLKKLYTKKIARLYERLKLKFYPKNSFSAAIQSAW